MIRQHRKPLYAVQFYNEMADLGLIVFLSFPLVNLRSVNFNRPVNPLHKRPTREEADRACVMGQLLNLAFGSDLDSPVKMKNRKLINRL